jgi:membrane protease YdiL (CAAX protease family)
MTPVPSPVATKRHTAILVFIFWLMGLVGSLADRSGTVEHAAPTARQTLQLYASALVIEWASVLYVWKGTRRRIHLRDLIGGRWQQPRDVAVDLLLAGTLWIVWLGIESGLPGTDTVRALLPQRALDAAVWILVALSAGFCEELVFRGYFQRQFHAFTGSLPAAIALQAFVFGFAHFYEGTWAVTKIVLYGALFGALAAWRRSLRPGMIAHAWSDLYGVVIFR